MISFLIELLLSLLGIVFATEILVCFVGAAGALVQAMAGGLLVVGTLALSAMLTLLAEIRR